MDEKEAFEHGRDSIREGANTTNCNFAIFATERLKTAWERGRVQEKKAIANIL